MVQFSVQCKTPYQYYVHVVLASGAVLTTMNRTLGNPYQCTIDGLHYQYSHTIIVLRESETRSNGPTKLLFGQSSIKHFSILGSPPSTTSR
eukprot:COSAG02_NODE_289_length_25587_cov_34.270323_5_plen_91_part_00